MFHIQPLFQPIASKSSLFPISPLILISTLSHRPETRGYCKILLYSSPTISCSLNFLHSVIQISLKILISSPFTLPSQQVNPIVVWKSELWFFQNKLSAFTLPLFYPLSTVLSDFFPFSTLPTSDLVSLVPGIWWKRIQNSFHPTHLFTP